RPAAAVVSARGRFEFLLTLDTPAAVALDGLRDLPARRAAAMRLHAVPEEGVVPHLRGIVEHAGLRGVIVARLDQLLERLALHWRAPDEIVEVGDVSLVMPAVVEIECLRRHMRLQRIFWVRTGRAFRSHGDHPGFCERGQSKNAGPRPTFR